MPILVGIIIDAIVWVFESRIGLFILSALVWLGISYGTQTIVIGPAITALQGYVSGMSSGSGMGAVAFNWIGVLRFDVALTMVISAYSTRVSVGAAKVLLKKV